MHELYKLKGMLCDELKEYGSKGEMSTGTLEIVDKLAHAVKNLDRIIEAYEEEEYSGNYMNEGGGQGDGSYRRGGGSNRGGSYRGGGSYARGRNARRDSMGRYSREGYSRADAREDMIEQLRDMMQSAPDERMRQRIEQLMREFEQQ